MRISPPLGAQTRRGFHELDPFNHNPTSLSNPKTPVKFCSREAFGLGHIVPSGFTLNALNVGCDVEIRNNGKES